jgi:hypothetical protein
MNKVPDIGNGYFEKGRSIGEIARETGRDRKTIRRYLTKDVRNRIKLRALRQFSTPRGSGGAIPPGYSPDQAVFGLSVF